MIKKYSLTIHLLKNIWAVSSFMDGPIQAFVWASVFVSLTQMPESTIEACFTAQHLVYPGGCFVCSSEEGTLCCWVERSIAAF